jgi:adenylylsulfate kinase
METHSRTIAKALTWRAGGFVMTVAIAWIVTRRADVAASIGVLDTAVKVAAYYFHERLWLKVRFGRKPSAEYEI